MDTNTKHRFTTGFTPLKNATHRDKALRSSIGNLSLTGFTTIEIAIVIVAAVVLIGIIFFAIKPSQQLIDSRDTQQLGDIK